MKKLLFLLLTLTLTGCAAFQVSTLNHDPIYSIEGSDAEIVVINNEFELQRLLRTDFNFRLDFAQYALSQPRSFDWNNRILGNRYNPYYRFGYSTYWNRDQMWNDWAWGYTSWNSWGSPHRWSPFGYDRWGYNNWTNNIHYGYGWNNYYGWNNDYIPYRWRRSNINGRRGNVSPRTRSTRVIRTRPTRTRTIPNNVRPTRTPIPNNVRTIRTPIRRSDVKPPIRTNTRPVNNTRPTNIRPVRTNTRTTTQPRRSKPTNIKKAKNK